MKIIVDAFGGDNAPLAVLQGAEQAVKELDVQIIAVGDEQKIIDCAKQNDISLENIEIVNATQVISMCDEPTQAIRSKKDSSMVRALRMLAEGSGDAVVSAGSTGALLAGATLIVKRLKGVKRAALAAILPGDKRPYMLLDCGANVECRSEMLVQFAVMGDAYMKNVMCVQNPEIALLNNGSEETKGTPLYVEAHQLLKQNKGINFIGNIEPTCVPKGDADVVVADGFAGNIVLKLTEGVAKVLTGEVKKVFLRNFVSKIAYLGVKSGLKGFKDKMDSEAYGGAPLLGVTKPVIKAHGSSQARGFKNAIRQAKNCVETNMIENMKKGLDEVEVQPISN